MKLSSLFSIILLILLLVGILPLMGEINKTVIIFSLLAYIYANFELVNSNGIEEIKITFRNILSLVLIIFIALIRIWIGNILI